MGMIRQIMGESMPTISDKKAINAFFAKMESAFKEFYLVHQEQRVFIPPELNSALEEYGRQMSDFVHDRLFDQRKAFIQYINKQEQKVMALMRASMGV
jgi:hypothetical protein